jgi:ATP-dependent RNA helicase DHX36
MDRLRELYHRVTGEQTSTGGLPMYRLAAPKHVDTLKPTETTGNSSIPCPIAVPVGDLAKEMERVVATQNEQPWLSSDEARVPLSGESYKANQSESELRRSSINRALKADLERKLRSSPTSQYQRLLKVRGRLPTFAMRDKIVQAIRGHQVTVIAGDTGCGKTTQVPQCVLDDMILSSDGANANIVVTQPRRISTIGVSERIASERCEHLGGTCGYSIKLERKASSATRLLFCTTGILLRRLQCDPDLASVSHGEFAVYAGCLSCSHLTVAWLLLVFVDEVHERDINTDFLLIILKALLRRRTSLKLVLMSATLNAEEFASYFENTALVTIPGRAYPVVENRLEDVLQLTGYQIGEGSDFSCRDHNSQTRISKNDLRKRYSKYSSDVIRSLSLVDETIINYELLADLVEHITQTCDDGAILIFLPGLLEIGKAIDELRKKEIFEGPRAIIYPLHSSLSSIDQRAVFSVPEKGVRKIVVATNIAETSITIEGEIFLAASFCKAYL